jgi:hypothetical protein
VLHKPYWLIYHRFGWYYLLRIFKTKPATNFWIEQQ